VSEIADKSETSTYPEIVADIRSSGFPDLVSRDALTIFSRIALAEARVHGVSDDELQLHELGQADAMSDVVGASDVMIASFPYQPSLRMRRRLREKTGVPVREVMRRIVDIAWIMQSEGAGDFGVISPRRQETLKSSTL
jgi:uncharacterized protein (DUF111 family)